MQDIILYSTALTNCRLKAQTNLSIILFPVLKLQEYSDMYQNVRILHFRETTALAPVLGQRADFVGAGKGLRQTAKVDPRTQTGLTRDFFADPNPDANNTVGRQGTSGRSAFRGPSFSVLSMSVVKKFKFGEDGRYAFSIRADAFNLLNSVNFKEPINSINSANFGRSTEAEAARQFQFSRRFDF